MTTCLIRPYIPLFGRSVSIYQICLIAGAALGAALALGLTTYRGLAIGVMVAIALAGLLTFFTQAMVTKIVTGIENMVQYHCALAAMLVATMLLWILGQPILPYLDAMILGIGMLVVCGRIGCLMTGCCYGRPHAWGVCYHHEHAAIGFPEYLVGVRLFPVQLVESLWALLIVGGGVELILNGAAAGATLAWYIILYALGRYFFEFVRGDPERPYWLNVSEAQWTCIVLSGLLVLAELSGVLSIQVWHSIVALGLGLVTLVIVVRAMSPLNKDDRLQQLPHWHELAQALHATASEARHAASSETNREPAKVYIVQTSLGIQISSSRITLPSGQVTHYTFSSQDSALNFSTAHMLTRFVEQSRRSLGAGTLIETRRGVFHLVMHQQIQNSKG